jgi:hypothetical protein
MFNICIVLYVLVERSVLSLSLVTTVWCILSLWVEVTAPRYGR